MSSPATLVVVVAVTAVLALVAAFGVGVRTGGASGRARAGRARELEPLRRAVSALHTPALVVTGDARVVHASDEALRLGLVRAGYLAHEELRDLLRPGRSDGAGPRTLSLPRGPVGDGHLEVRATVTDLGERYLLLDLENRSEAMRVEDVRRDFVVNVSHELKTPVGAISVLAETLEQAVDDPEAVRRFTARIRQEVRRLGVLVADVLELSRVQVVDGTPRRAEVGLDHVVAHALDEVGPRADEHGITLRRGGIRGAVVLGDEELLTTAVRNLVGNAVSYSPPQTTVSVSVGRKDGLVVVQVTDRGIGIPVEEQERVFERFYRVDPARSRQTGGTGLGLAIVKHVMDAHGGDVQVWSRPGQGSTFTLRLPDADPAPPEEPTPTTPTGHDGPTAPAPHGGPA
ncbi:sensor histidine kinase [Jannaschia sp. R86511]|uniref:sensor histidine kinase n=1 Tax=Jannaschia sp. R86511 TaxID=3093853 RepID=UPI0036D3F8A6